MVEEGLVGPDQPVRFSITGDAGIVPSPTATSLAVVLTELLQNVVEHAYPPGLDLRVRPAEVRLSFHNDGTTLTGTVSDDGIGLRDGFDLTSTTSLGLSIVRNLVTTELGGRIEIEPGNGEPPRRGTVVRLSLPVAVPTPDA
jgi:two-component sensor histidine kinase